MNDLTHWEVRVTRSSDGDYADVPVQAADWKTAKEKAIALVVADPHTWFDDEPPPTYAVDLIDDDEETGRVVE